MDRLGGYFGAQDEQEDYDDFVDGSEVDLDSPPSPVGQDERRMQVRAYNHWASLLGDLNFPNVEDLDPESLDDFGPYSVLLDFTDGIDDPGVRFVGRELEAECGHDSSMARLSEVPGRSVLSRITDHYMQILANQAPIGFEAEFVNDHGTTVLYRGILLPFSSNDASIDYIFGVINWKEMADPTTADELLLQIDQALGKDSDDAETGQPVETAECLVEDEREDAMAEPANAEMAGDGASLSLPSPAFGQNVVDDNEESSPETFTERAAKPGRGVDALGNPVGGHVFDDEGAPENDYAEEFDTGIKTAADYGLPDWDDEPDEEDVDDVVDPLADEETSSSLISLVSRGERSKKSVDLSRTEAAPAVPQAYEATPERAEPAVRQDDEPVVAENPGAFDVSHAEEPNDDTVDDVVNTAQTESESSSDPIDEADAGPVEPNDEADSIHAPIYRDGMAGEGLFDCLAEARELAQTAQNNEDRSRKALYEAVGRAYDFSLEAQENCEEYEDLLADNGLTVQERAPMTPVVKLVFGVDYDKTRLTEYAAVLAHAHRLGVERGTLDTFLRKADGGLKGVLNAERRARKEEQGKPVADRREVRGSLARKLRKIEPLSLADLDDVGAEFALVMVRRTPEGELVVLGEVPEDVPLIERAARKLIG